MNQDTKNINPEELSPEQLLELQKKNCIFCNIASKNIQAKIIYEDDECLAFLDINPLTPGHTLVIPKEHYQIFPQMPENLISHLLLIARKISHAMLKVLKARGTMVFIANGLAAGQKAPHVILHIIPRYEDDKIKFPRLDKKQDKKEVYDKILSMIKGKK